MKKVRKPFPTEFPLLFDIDPEPIPETLTALGGVPLLVQTFRSLGLEAVRLLRIRVWRGPEFLIDGFPDHFPAEYPFGWNQANSEPV